MEKKLKRVAIIMIGLLMATLFLKTEAANKIPASADNPRVQWMKGKYGLMVHWLAPGPPPQKGEQIKDLNKAIDNFDLKGFMADFDKTGAQWLIFTIGQNSGFYASPNSVIDSLAGIGHTPRRDLVLEIAKELKKRGKRFIAYLPCEVRENKSLHKGFSWNTQEVTNQAVFQEKYLRAVREWAVRYGDYLDGWWLDGCYTWAIFHNKYVMWDKWFEACRAGNKNAVVSFNDGSYCTNNTKPTVPMLDYVSGETEVLIQGKIRLARESQSQLFIPDQAYVPEKQCLFHALVPIDALWAHGNRWQNFVNAPFSTIMPKSQEDMEPPVYSDSDLIQFVKAFTDAGVKPGFYYSTWDRNCRFYDDDKRYAEYMRKQVKELLITYGNAVEWWFDGSWDKDHPTKSWEFDPQWEKDPTSGLLHGERYEWKALYELIHSLQSDSIVLHNSSSDRPGGIRYMPCDARTAEQFDFIIREKLIEPIIDPIISQPEGNAFLPLEFESTLSPNWFWDKSDYHFHPSLATIADWYIRARTANANLLLNVGPNMDGLIPDYNIQFLKKVRDKLGI